MPPPPPPPPPPPGGLAPPPPPPPMNGFSGPKSKSSHNLGGSAPDRGALLAQIRSGATLKKAKVVNDRSSPLVVNGKSGSSSNTTANSGLSSSNSKSTSNLPSNTSAPGPINLGGIFANGMPKLRQTGSKLVESRNNSSNNQSTIVSGANNGASKDGRGVNGKSEEKPSFKEIQSSLSGKLNFGISNTSSSGQSKNTGSNAAKTREAKNSFLNSLISATDSGESLANSQNSGNEPLSSSSSSRNEPEVPFSNPENKFHTINVSKMQRERKTEERRAMLSALSSQSVNVGGSPSSTKGQAPPVPGHGPRTNQDGSSNPPLPSKPPSVHRSNSHASGRSKHSSRPAPPSCKPPPPPKDQPRLDQIKRRESFGGSENKISIAPTSAATMSSGNLNQNKPPPPPRNSSTNASCLSLNGNPPQPPSTAPVGPAQLNRRSQHGVPVASVAPMPPTRTASHYSGSSPRPTTGPPPPPSCPPPPPPVRTTSTHNLNQNTWTPPPPSQAKVSTTASSSSNLARNSFHSVDAWNNASENANDVAPPPPTRTASMSREGLIGTRFNSLFKPICTLPPPEVFRNCEKIYPSQMHQQSHKRGAPPPPPQKQHLTTNDQLNHGYHSNYGNRSPTSNHRPMLSVAMDGHY